METLNPKSLEVDVQSFSYGESRRKSTRRKENVASQTETVRFYKCQFPEESTGLVL
jgi:hypothetical protein